MSAPSLDPGPPRAAARGGARFPPGATDARRALFLQHGGSPSSFFHFQEGVRFFDLVGTGYLALDTHRGPWGPTDVVFADPVCAPQDLPRLIDAFLDDHGGHPVFAGVGADTAAVLRERGYTTNMTGIETSLDVPSYSLSGRPKRHLRTAANNHRRGIEVRELPFAELPFAGASVDDVRRISTRWRAEKRVTAREIRLLTRPPAFHDEWHVRKLFAFQDGRLVAFAFFDPICADGAVVGYTANILRAAPGLRPTTVLDTLVLEGMRRFRDEGRRLLSLGPSPLYALRPCAGESRRARAMMRAVYRHGDALYRFRALASHKRHYRGEERPLYACYRGMGPLRAGTAVFVASHVVPGPTGGSSARSAYGRVAGGYQRLARAYSLGHIEALKAQQMASLPAPSRVLVVGGGEGEEAVAAARAGHHVTMVELSAAMLRVARRAALDASVEIRFVEGDALAYSPPERFDFVAAHFFLNVFSPDEARAVLRHLATLLVPGGAVGIVDFAPPEGVGARSQLQRAYYAVPAAFFRAVARSPLHPVYDYEPWLKEAGFVVENRGDEALTRWGVPAFRSLVARRGPTGVDPLRRAQGLTPRP